MIKITLNIDPQAWARVGERIQWPAKAQALLKEWDNIIGFLSKLINDKPIDRTQASMLYSKICPEVPAAIRKWPFIHHYTPKDMQIYQDSIKSIIRSNLPANWVPLDEPLVLDMIFYMVSPQKPRWPVPAVKPDDENLSKNISDAFNKLIWFDDSRVVDRRIRKRYSQTGKGYIEIRIKRWTADENMNEIEFNGKQMEL